MKENTMVKCLGNDVIRRFLNTEENLLKAEAKALIDGYSVKLLTSGFSVGQTTRIVMSGIRGFESRLRRCVKEGRPLYRTSAQSAGSRRKKKLLGKSDWFKKRRKKSTTEEESGMSGRQESRKVMRKSGELPTTTVMFVGFTPNGGLAKALREEMGKIEGMLGFRMRIVEKCGIPLKLSFSPSKLWEGVRMLHNLQSGL